MGNCEDNIMSKFLLPLSILSIIFTPIIYADNFHVTNNSNKDVTATIYFNGQTEGAYNLKKGQEYVHSFWHNLRVNVVISDPKTKSTICSLEVKENKYRWATFGPLMPTPHSNYQPQVIPGLIDCAYTSSFNQANWAQEDYTKRPPGPNFSYVIIKTSSS